MNLIDETIICMQKSVFTLLNLALYNFYRSIQTPTSEFALQNKVSKSDVPRIGEISFTTGKMRILRELYTYSRSRSLDSIIRIFHRVLFELYI